MHRYSPDYESQFSAVRYNLQDSPSRNGFGRSFGLTYKTSLMEKVKRFVHENFFFRIEGVDSDDDEQLIISDSNGKLSHEFRSVEEKEKGQNVNYMYDGHPEVVVDDSCSSSSRVSSPELKIEIAGANTEPTQLSCLSISVYSAVIIAMVLIFLFIGRDYVKYILFSLQEADFWISLIVFVLLFTVVSFPMTWGYILLNIAAGYLYGLLLGLVIVISCALTGLLIAHCVIRRCLRNFVLSKFTNKSFVSIMNVVDHSSIGFKVVIWARLTPIPFGLQNALFGVCGISTPRFILASVLGMLPTQGMHCYIGSTLRSMEEVISNSSGSTTAYIIFGAQLVIAIGLLCFVIRRARYEFNRMVQQNARTPGAEPPSDQLKPVMNDNHGNICMDMAEKTISITTAHSRSASVPGTLSFAAYQADRPRTSSFSPKSPTRD